MRPINKLISILKKLRYIAVILASVGSSIVAGPLINNQNDQPDRSPCCQFCSQFGRMSEEDE